MTSSYFDYQVASQNLDRTRINLLKNGASNREIEYFSEKIGEISNADELIADQRLYRFALTAFGLESQFFAKGLIKKVLDEGVQDQRSLANRLADRKFRQFASAFAFAEVGDFNVKKPEFVAGVVDKYLSITAETKAGENNIATRLGLYFDRVSPGLTSWYGVLADKALREVVRVAAGLPPQIDTLNPDRLVELYESRFDLEDFKDPAKRDAFIRRFSVLYDIENGAPGAQSQRAALFQPLSSSSGPQIITIDPATLRAGAFS